MSLLMLEDATLSFGARRILDGVNLRFGEGEHVGLVGPNGSGKSTLLRILADEQGLDGGRVNRSRACRVGYLPQDIETLPGETVLEAVLAAVPGRGDVEARLAAVEASLVAATDPDEMMELAGVVAELHEELDYFETFFSERRALQILTGLGFSEGGVRQRWTELSGGWRMRVALAGLLFQAPDLLLLDEPTNHLDAPSVAWLDRFLDGWARSIVLICHDRAFLNRHAERVISFEPEGVRTWTGNWDDYLEQRALEEDILEARARNQEQKLRELQRFVDRFKAKATKARQAQSREKWITKIEKELVKPVVRPRKLAFTFPPVAPSGRDVLRAEGLGKRFGDNVLYRGVNLTVRAGDRIAILGVNGAGKTTLLRMLAGELTPDEGRVVVGTGVERRTYAQHHTEALIASRTVLEEVSRARPDAGQTRVRGVCGAFLFPADDVDKPVGVLSGGERARVLLARLLLDPGNVLLLDEPTNHLDLGAAEALADALEGYGGTILLVSHNESLVNRIATKVWDVGEGKVVEYPGNLQTYLDHLERRRAEAEQVRGGGGPRAAEAKPAAPAERPGPTPPGKATAPGRPTAKGGSQPPPKASQGGAGTKAAPAPPKAPPQAKPPPKQPAPSAAERPREHRTPEPAPRPPHAPKAAPERQKPRAGDPQALAERIAALEAEIAPLAAQLADPEIYGDAARFQELLARHMAGQRKIEELRGRIQRG
ncbi:MAG: ABC transporter ATP-binding protein [Myxococcales bacterium]